MTTSRIKSKIQSVDQAVFALDQNSRVLVGGPDAMFHRGSAAAKKWRANGGQFLSLFCSVDDVVALDRALDELGFVARRGETLTEWGAAFVESGGESLCFIYDGASSLTSLPTPGSSQSTSSATSKFLKADGVPLVFTPLSEAEFSERLSRADRLTAGARGFYAESLEDTSETLERGHGSPYWPEMLDDCYAMIELSTRALPSGNVEPTL